MILLCFLIFSEDLHALQGLLLYYFLTFMIIAVAAATVLQLFSFLLHFNNILVQTMLISKASRTLFRRKASNNNRLRRNMLRLSHELVLL